MSQNNQSKWPKAFVAIFGITAISATSYFLKEPHIMWSIFFLYFIVENFD